MVALWNEAVVEPAPPEAAHELPDVGPPCPSLPAEKAPTTPEEMRGWDLVDDVGASVPILVERASSSSAFRHATCFAACRVCWADWLGRFSIRISVKVSLFGWNVGMRLWK